MNAKLNKMLVFFMLVVVMMTSACTWGADIQSGLQNLTGNPTDAQKTYYSAHLNEAKEDLKNASAEDKPEKAAIVAKWQAKLDGVTSGTPITNVVQARTGQQVVLDPTPTPAGVVVPASSVVTATVVADDCRNGEVIGNMKNKIDRTPIGDGKRVNVQEVSVPDGKGFGNYWRWIQITTPLNGKRQVFDVAVATIHEVRYCGSPDEVKAYVSQVATHITAMVQSAADTQGHVPATSEIPVVMINSDTGEVSWVVTSTDPKAPTMDIVKSHIEVVDTEHSKTLLKATAQVKAVGGSAPVADCNGTGASLWPGEWKAQNRTVNGPAIVNFGRPAEGTAQYRTYVAANTTVTFLSAAGNAWPFTPTCSEDQLKEQVKSSTGGLPVMTIAELKAKGWVK